MSTLLQNIDPAKIIEAVKDYWGVIALVVLVIVFLAFLALIVATRFGIAFLPHNPQPHDVQFWTGVVLLAILSLFLIIAFTKKPQWREGPYVRLLMALFAGSAGWLLSGEVGSSYARSVVAALDSVSATAGLALFLIVFFLCKSFTHFKPSLRQQACMEHLLEVAVDGKEHTLKDAFSKLKDLTYEEKTELLPTGFAWARRHLTDIECLRVPRRGFFMITDKGKEEQQKNASRQDWDFLKQFRKARR